MSENAKILVQIGSDFHLSEYGRHIEESVQITENSHKTVLILPGDISIFRDPKRIVKDDNYQTGWYGMIDWFCDNFKFTFLVPGNHEFFDSTFEEGIQFISECNRYRPDKFKILYNDVAQLTDTYWLAGTTMWSEIPNYYTKNKNNDCRRIKDWSLKKHTREFRCAKSFLNRVLSDTSKKWFVVTHHCPSTYNTSTFLYSVEDSNCAYSSYLEEMWSKSVVWFFGHTHWNISHKHPSGHGWLVSNCQGKNKEYTGRSYKTKFIIEV